MISKCTLLTAWLQGVCSPFPQCTAPADVADIFEQASSSASSFLASNPAPENPADPQKKYIRNKILKKWKTLKRYSATFVLPTPISQTKQLCGASQFFCPVFPVFNIVLFIYICFTFGIEEVMSYMITVHIFLHLLITVPLATGGLFIFGVTKNKDTRRATKLPLLQEALWTDRNEQ